MSESATVLTSLRTTLTWRGALAVLVGVVAVLWPGLTVTAFVVLFAVHALLLAGADVRGALRAGTTPGRVGYAALAAISAAAGVLALIWPGATVTVIAVVVAGWALFSGTVELLLAIRHHATTPERTTWTIGGLVSVALAVTLLVRPDLGVLALTTAYGLFSIMQGVTALVLAVRVHRLDAGITRLVTGS